MHLRIRRHGCVHFSVPLRQNWIYYVPTLMRFPPPQRPAETVKATETLERLSVLFSSLLALVSYALVLVVLVARIELPGKPGWAEALLVFTTTIATLAALSRHLPLQNVLLASVIIALIGSISHTIGAITGIPFGPFTYLENVGPRIFDTLAWPIPLLWILVILNSRGVARLILRPWRKMRTYGFWLIGITAVLAMLLDAAMEPFMALVKHYWFWQPTRIPFTIGSAPVTNVLGWLLTALLILAFATPTLIDKRARPTQRPPDYHPLVTWLLALILFAVGTAMNQFWIPVIFSTVIGVTVTLFAVRGARW